MPSAKKSYSKNAKFEERLGELTGIKIPKTESLDKRIARLEKIIGIENQYKLK